MDSITPRETKDLKLGAWILIHEICNLTSRPVKFFNGYSGEVYEILSGEKVTVNEWLPYESEVRCYLSLVSSDDVKFWFFSACTNSSNNWVQFDDGDYCRSKFYVNNNIGWNSVSLCINDEASVTGSYYSTSVTSYDRANLGTVVGKYLGPLFTTDFSSINPRIVSAKDRMFLKFKNRSIGE